MCFHVELSTLQSWKRRQHADTRKGRYVGMGRDARPRVVKVALILYLCWNVFSWIKYQAVIIDQSGTRLRQEAWASSSPPVKIPPSEVTVLQRNTGFSSRYSKSIRAGGLYQHLKALQEIAESNNLDRSAGSTGYQASVEYVLETLRAAGYDTVRQEAVSFPFLKELSPPLLNTTPKVNHTIVANGPHTFYALGGFNGTVVAPVTAVHVKFQPNQTLPRTASGGCDRAHFSGFPTGNIALLQGGACNPFAQIQNALNAGAAGILFSNEGMDLEGYKEAFFVPVALGCGVPALFISSSLGMALMETMSHTVLTATITTSTVNEVVTDYNILAETSHGDPSQTIIVGAHLDSAKGSPGINDNGSAAAAALELAKQLIRNGFDSKYRLKRKIRFAWWACEESGLWGSSSHVRGLSEEEKDKIVLYLNLDMMASVNFTRAFSYEHNTTFSYQRNDTARRNRTPETLPSLEQSLFEYFEREGLSAQQDPMSRYNGRSDNTGFYMEGIPTAMLTTAAELAKTLEEAEARGVEPVNSIEVCMHEKCDQINNTNITVLEEMTRAAAHAISILASESS